MPIPAVLFRPSRRAWGIALAPFVVLVAANCGDDDGAAEPSGDPAGALSGTFLSTEITGESFVEGTRLTLVFDDGNLAAVAGCNNLIGAYEIVDGVLEVDELAQTLMGCEEDLQRQDEWISNLLTSGPTVTLDEDVLTVTGEDVTIVFGEREVPEAADPLAGSAWEIVSLDDAETSMEAPEDASLVFAEGMVNIATGCNRGFAEATVGDGSLTIGPIGLTRMACPGPVGEWETALVEFLEGDHSFVSDGEQLTLSKGGQTLTLRPVE